MVFLKFSTQKACYEESTEQNYAYRSQLHKIQECILKDTLNISQNITLYNFPWVVKLCDFFAYISHFCFSKINIYYCDCKEKKGYFFSNIPEWSVIYWWNYAAWNRTVPVYKILQRTRLHVCKVQCLLPYIVNFLQAKAESVHCLAQLEKCRQNTTFWRRHTRAGFFVTLVAGSANPLRDASFPSPFKTTVC